MRSRARERSMTSTHCAKPGAERCDRPTSAPDKACGDQPGRLAHGPDEKHGLAGRRVGFMTPSLPHKIRPRATGVACGGEPYVRARDGSIQRACTTRMRRPPRSPALKKARASKSEDREADDRVVPGLANLGFDAKPVMGHRVVNTRVDVRCF